MQNPSNIVDWETVEHSAEHPHPSAPANVPFGTYAIVPKHPFRPGMDYTVINQFTGTILYPEDRTPENEVLHRYLWRDDAHFWRLVEQHTPEFDAMIEADKAKANKD
jgi:hypothetical protein